jgi:hypothetical protein
MRRPERRTASLAGPRRCDRQRGPDNAHSHDPSCTPPPGGVLCLFEHSAGGGNFRKASVCYHLGFCQHPHATGLTFVGKIGSVPFLPIVYSSPGNAGLAILLAPCLTFLIGCGLRPNVRERVFVRNFGSLPFFRISDSPLVYSYLTSDLPVTVPLRL